MEPVPVDPQTEAMVLNRIVDDAAVAVLHTSHQTRERSYTPERAHRPDTVELWRKISTVEDPEWTRCYHSTDPAEKAFGARAEVTLNSGEVITDELAVADAHPLGARPFQREQYVRKFTELTDGVVKPAEQQRFLSIVDSLANMKAGVLGALNVLVDPAVLDKTPSVSSGIFR